MDPRLRRLGDRTTLPHRSMRNYEPATSDYNFPRDARPSYLPADGQQLRQRESSDQESLSDEDGTIDRMNQDSQRYQYGPRDATSRRRSTDENIPQQASRHNGLTPLYPVHNKPKQASAGKAKVKPPTGSQLPFTQASLAFQSTLNPMALGFVAMELDDYKGCHTYIRRNKELLDTEPQAFLTEAVNALKARKELYAKSCLEKAKLIQFCGDLSAKEIRAFFDDLEEEGQQYKEFKLEFTDAWARLQTRVGKITLAVSPSAEVPTTAQSHRPSQVHPLAPPTLGPHHEAVQRGVSLNTQMPVYQTSGGNREQDVRPTKTASDVVMNAETTSYFELFARLLTGKRIEAVKEAKCSSDDETFSHPQRHGHPSFRRTPTFGTQWIDVYAPRAKSNWPIEGWPYIPTLAFLDSGSRGNVNSVSKDFLEEKLNMTYRSTDDKIRGHENSFTPLGIVKIEFHPVTTNVRGEAEADLPVTLSFYVHNDNDLFGQMLLGREYMRSQADKIGLPTYKETLKMSPEEQKIANERMAKRDAVSQRIWDANNSANPAPGNSAGSQLGQRGTYRNG